MRHFRAISSAILALGVVSLIAYFIAKKVELPVPENQTRLTIDLAKAPCENTQFLEEQVAREIAESKTCLVDADCESISLGCPFGCRVAVNRSKISKINELAGLISPQCRSCVYRCASGDFKETCDAGVCRSVRLGPNIQPGMRDDA